MFAVISGWMGNGAFLILAVLSGIAFAGSWLNLSCDVFKTPPNRRGLHKTDLSALWQEAIVA